MTKEQEEQSVRLIKKYGFEDEIAVSMEQSRYIALMLGIAYGLSDDEIAKYMEIKFKSFTGVDLRRICVMLGIELGDDADNELNLGQVKGIIYGSDDEERNLLERYQAVFNKYHISLEAAEAGDILIRNMVSNEKPYSRLTNHILNGKELSPAQLNLVLKAVKEKIPEEYIMRFALPEVSVFQMEKAIEIYKLRKKKSFN
ncbi:MAG: hypothetical protein K5656_04465 [Lachnospiraceae bacterium]|nr:hypothetical protein [Lachnospiraceae bacterium]